MRLGRWVLLLHLWAAVLPASAASECRGLSFERATLTPFTAPWHDPRCLTPPGSAPVAASLTEVPSGARATVFSEGLRRESAALPHAHWADSMASGFGLASLDLSTFKSAAAMAQDGDRAVYAWVTHMTTVGGTRHEVKKLAAGVHMPGGQILQLLVLGAMGLVLLRRQWSMG